MAAEVLANELRLDLYRIDLSAVVSKYIGETEKNLRRVFDAAEDGGAILFFDEADALFGKRSEVKDSHDRYANIEINYLLQRMEAYRGLAILATNMKSALDTAFMRRLRFVVNFPFPGAAERDADLASASSRRRRRRDGLDYDRLARLNLTGGSIHNIALNAAFLAAAARRSAVTMPLVLDAARGEFRKLERPINEADFRPLAAKERGMKVAAAHRPAGRRRLGRGAAMRQRRGRRRCRKRWLERVDAGAPQGAVAGRLERRVAAAVAPGAAGRGAWRPAMSGFPGSPRLMKGAIVGIDPFNPLASIIIFQYNPDTLTRTLQPQTAAVRGRRARPLEALRLKGAPVETIKLDVEIDATDQLERANPTGRELGIYPQLSALEMLVYPEERAGHRQHGAAGARHDRDHAAGRAVDAVRLGAEAGAAGALTEFTSPRRPTTRASTRSAPRSRSACACSATTTSRSRIRATRCSSRTRSPRRRWPAHGRRASASGSRTSGGGSTGM